MPKPISEQVVVVTGASSGIGMATSIRLAANGARVVLAARRGNALDAIAHNIEAHGGRAFAQPTDVSDWNQIERLAVKAIDQYGGIDTWVNAAALAVYGRIDRITPEEARRLIEVNLLGAMYGSMAAARLMQDQGGTIINVSSIIGKRGAPYQSPYAASKFGIVGFDEAIRSELAPLGINVCTVMPTSMNTPFFDHALSKEGVRPKPFPPVSDPYLVADRIVRLAQHPQRDVPVGRGGRFFLIQSAIAPRLVDWFMTRFGWSLQFGRVSDRGQSNIFQTMLTGASSRAGWGFFGRRSFVPPMVQQPRRANDLDSAPAGQSSGTRSPLITNPPVAPETSEPTAPTQ